MAKGRAHWKSLGGEALKALLAAPMLAKTEHFILHAAEPLAQKLPTDAAPTRAESVDNMAIIDLAAAFVVPKRHARRAVTRNLIKRQMRAALQRRGSDWPAKQLLIRQRAPFELARYASAASAVLRVAVRTELESLLDRAATR